MALNERSDYAGNPIIDGIDVTVPLYSTTWDLDKSEGVTVSDMKATHLEPYGDRWISY